MNCMHGTFNHDILVESDNFKCWTLKSNDFGSGFQWFNLAWFLYPHDQSDTFQYHQWETICHYHAWWMD